MNETEVSERLEKYSGLESTREPADFGELGGNLTYGGSFVSFEALRTAARWAGIPAKFLLKCPVDLQEILLNRFFKDVSGYPKTVFKESEIFAFINPSATQISPWRVIKTMEQSISSLEIERVYSTNGSVEIYTVGPKEHAVAVGDIVRGGVWISFSPFGEANPEVAGYTYRLACLNGMVREKEYARFSYARDGDPYEWIGSSTQNLYGAIEDEIERYRAMREVKLNGNLSSILNHLIESLPRDVQDLVKDYVLDRKPETMYDLMCLVTEFASHHLKNPRNIWSVMSVGGRTVEHLEICETCHQLIRR